MAGVAHDFNNLLGVIGGFSKLGQARSDHEQDSYYFDQITAASERATALTRQLLTFGREQALAPALINLNDAIDSLSSLLDQLLPSSIELRMTPSARPVEVFVDRSQLEQVLVNLVINSRDAIEGTGSVTISTMTSCPRTIVHDDPTPCGWFQIADTGTGISDEVMPRIFDPYFSTKPAETSTGLGLATIYGIISQSGGSIFVESTVGAGTSMTVALPSGPGTISAA